MKRSGFTLIELIFVIVIIGVLAAVAIPKFQNLKENAEAKNVIKIMKDTESSVASSYTNFVDLEETITAANIDISDLITISGKGWTHTAGTAADATNSGSYAFKDDTEDVVTITLVASTKTLTTTLICANFKSPSTQEKCTSIGATGATITW